jgi:hypothetical protein
MTRLSILDQAAVLKEANVVDHRRGSVRPKLTSW